MQLESYKCSLQIVLIILVNICLQALLLHKKKGRKEKEERKRRQERKREGKEARKREREKEEGRRKKERKRETDKPQREEGIPWQLRENTVAKIPQYIHVNHPILKYLEQELKILRPPK